MVSEVNGLVFYFGKLEDNLQVVLTVHILWKFSASYVYKENAIFVSLH